MKSNTNTAFLALFVLLALAASFPFWKGYLPFGKGSPAPSGFDFSTLEKDKINKIVIKNADEEKVLVKEGGSWKIGGFEVSSAEIDRFFEALTGLEIGELVSKNPENHANFGLGEGEGITLVLSGGNKSATFVIGRVGPARDSFYIKRKDGEQIYSARGNLRSQLLQDSSQWQVKTDGADGYRRSGYAMTMVKCKCLIVSS